MPDLPELWPLTYTAILIGDYVNPRLSRLDCLGDLFGAPDAPTPLASERIRLGDLRDLYSRLDFIPVNRKNLVMVPSDYHSCHALVSDHVGVNASQSSALPLNTIDYVYWRLSTALLSCAFDGEDCDAIFGTGDDVKRIGSWSDGVPVKECLTADELSNLGY
jgi:hypothetical protein